MPNFAGGTSGTYRSEAIEELALRWMEMHRTFRALAFALPAFALAADGLVKLSADGLQVTDLGRLFLRNIAVCFDAYYAPESKRHSRTV